MWCPKASLCQQGPELGGRDYATSTRLRAGPRAGLTAPLTVGCLSGDRAERDQWTRPAGGAACPGPGRPRGVSAPLPAPAGQPHWGAGGRASCTLPRVSLAGWQEEGTGVWPGVLHTLVPDPFYPHSREGRALQVRVSDCIPLSQRGARRLVSVEACPEQQEPDFRCSRGAFTLLWPGR